MRFVGIRPFFMYALTALGLMMLGMPAAPLESASNVGDIVSKSPLTTEKDRGLLFGGCDADPYAILEKYGGRGVLLRPTQSGNVLRNGIDPALACRLAKMLQFADQKGCRARISSGYRSAAKQAAMCGGGGTGCARAGNSCHQYGLAVDIDSSCLGWLKQIAPQFRLIQNNIPGDPYHFQCAEHRGASRRSCTDACNGGLAITPDFSNMPTAYADAPATPSSGIANAARNFFNPQPQPQQTPSQPLAQSSQPKLQQPPALGTENATSYPPGTCPPQFYCQNSIYYYRSSTCVDQKYQKCPAGCAASGNACASTSTSQGSGTAIDAIAAIAEPGAAPSGSVGDLLFELAISGEDAATLEYRTASSTTLAIDGSYIPPPLLAQQTFVSDDLRYSPAQEFPPQQLSTVQRTLASMKETLLRALSYLRPFARSASATEAHEWVE